MPIRSKLDKNAVYFKFAHEGHSLEKVEFYGKEIAVGDLRHTIAEMKKLPKVDLQILNDSGEVYTRDGHLLKRNIIVTVRRTPVQTQKKPQVLDLEGADIFAPLKKKAKVVKKVEPEVPPEQKAPCPPEYLCPLCRGIFENPAIARCCGRSACTSCFEERAVGACPLCARQWADEKPLPNPRLAEIVASLNLDFFQLPAKTVERQAALRGNQGPPKTEAPAGPAASPPVAAPAAPAAARAAQAAPAAPAAVAAPVAAPAGVTLVPCMLSPEQFHAWQQSLLQSKTRKLRRERKPRD